MCNEIVIARALIAAGLFLVVGCTQQTPAELTADDRNVMLGRALSSVGFPCQGTVNSQELNETGTSLRVACANADVYLASIQENGEICIEPVIYADLSLSVAPIMPLQSRCVSDIGLL